MDGDIQFGEVEQATPGRRRRPDRDRHFAVATYGAPGERDLPIYVDVDVLADMEDHARSDPSVELGGVMLGGQFTDEQGRPFVLVLDSLRAQHYDSSRGHFKFTHDTWSRIARQREEFSEDLQMVGWYHTHPDWGVFLSGMDRFICDNFFNRPLDVAFVIDPVRDDRGWFYWDREAADRLPKAAGFGVTASRFRRRELTHYVRCLEEHTAMTPQRASDDSPWGAAARLPQHVMHTIRPNLGWLGAAVVAILLLQSVATLLLALRLGAPAAGDRQTELDRREQQLAGREEAFGKLLGAVKVQPDGKIDIKTLVDENAALRGRVDRLSRADLLLDELARNFEGVKKQRDKLAGQNGQLQRRVDELTAARLADGRRIRQLEAQLAQRPTSRPASRPGDATDAIKGLSGSTIALILLAGVVVVVAVTAIALGRRRIARYLRRGP